MLSKKQKQNTLDEADFVRDVDKSANHQYLIVRLLVIRPVIDIYPDELKFPITALIRSERG
jgi:hypothetical protein